LTYFIFFRSLKEEGGKNEQKEKDANNK